jgi:hypothetical protein
VSVSDNQKKAPICAAFVEEMRTCFPELVVLYVRENGVELGEPGPMGVVAAATFVQKKK